MDEQIMSDILEEHRDVWESLAKGHTAKKLEIAALLRGIAAKIESPEPHTNLVAELEYALKMAKGEETAQTEQWWEQFCGSADSTPCEIPGLIVIN